MSYWMNDVELSDLEGKKIVTIIGLEKGSKQVDIYTDDGNHYRFYHQQDCCEDVALVDFEVSSHNLSGSTILKVEEVINENNGEKPDEWSDSFTWTFYKIETDKGGLWMRWLGESNGYYSESVSLILVDKPTIN